MSQEGGNAVYRPQDLPPNQTFTLTVAPFQDLAGQQFDQWFESRAQADVVHRGKIRGTQQARSPQPGFLLKTEFVNDSAGKLWVIIYSASSTGNTRGQFASMVSNLTDQSKLTDNIRIAATVLGQNLLAANAGGRSAPATPLSVAGTTGNRPPFSLGLPRSIVGTSLPEPVSNSIKVSVSGTGVPESNIEAVLYEGHGQTTVTGYAYVETAHLLLKDGWAYSELDVPPADLDVAAARRVYPARWHQWRTQGKEIYLRDQRSGQWSRLDGTYIRPLEPQLNLRLIHRNSISHGGMGSYNTTNWITFKPDGTFERARSVLAGSGAVQAAGGFSGSTASFQDRNGTSASSSGTYSGGGTAGAYGRQQSRSSNLDTYGRYKVFGYTLELDLANGQVQRLLAFHPFSDKFRDSAYIDGTTYNAISSSVTGGQTGEHGRSTLP